MICPLCQAVFSYLDRDKHLSNESLYLASDNCINCIIAELHTTQNKIYPELKEVYQNHAKIKALYVESTSQLAKVQSSYYSIDRERNLILHNINRQIELDEQKAKELDKKQVSKKESKKATLSAEDVNAMLANLPSDQRAAILANYNKA